MTEGFIFDLDGIIVDTVPIHFKAWKKMFSEYGIDFTFSDYKKKVDGIPRLDGAEAVLKDLEIKELKRAAGRKQKYFRDELDRGQIPVYQSTIKLINKLQNLNALTAVISSSKNCTYILKKIGLYDSLDAVVDGNRNLKGKPDPQIFLTAAEEMKADPERCVVFEDAVLGVKAAGKAGMYVIGVDRYSDPDRLEEADRVISDTAEVVAEELLKIF